MVGARHITAKERDAFLAELDALCRKYHIVIDPCNCAEYEQCQHVALVRLDEGIVFLGYAHDTDYRQEPEGSVIGRLHGLTRVPAQPKPEVPTW